jgi:hypothetical protein
MRDRRQKAVIIDDDDDNNDEFLNERAEVHENNIFTKH